MAICVRTLNNGNLRATSEQVGSCREFIVLEQTELDALSASGGSFDIANIDPIVAAEYFGTGFALVIPILVLAFSIRKIFQLLN